MATAFHTTEQLLQVATQFDRLSLQRPEIKEYPRVALIHHHPFTFETPKETLVSRMLEKINITVKDGWSKMMILMAIFPPLCPNSVANNGCFQV